MLDSSAPPEAAAHDQGARLELSAERLPAGGTLGVRGVNFDAETTVNLVLEGATGTITLGAPVTDASGAFDARFVVPQTLVPGSYTVQALLPEHAVVSAPLTIAGQLQADEQGARRDVAEPLRQSVPAAVSATNVPVPPTADSPPLPWWLPLGLVLALAGIGAAYIRRGRQLLR